MEHVIRMVKINTKSMFHIDEFVISSFCPNTIKVNGSFGNKFQLFSKYLTVFHDDESIYEQNIHRYSSFISYKVLIDSLVNNNNILTYESYLFNTLKGFSEQIEGKPLVMSQLVKIWNNLIQIYNVLLELSKDSSVKSIKYNFDIYLNLKHINVDKMSSNYYMTIPILIEYEDKVLPILFIPKETENLQSNLAVYLPLKYFGKQVNKMIIFGFSMYNFSYTYNVTTIGSKYFKDSLNFIESCYIDFNRVNTFNCINCPLVCNTSEILNLKYKIEPYNPKNRLIKIRK